MQESRWLEQDTHWGSLGSKPLRNGLLGTIAGRYSTRRSHPIIALDSNLHKKKMWNSNVIGRIVVTLFSMFVWSGWWMDSSLWWANVRDGKRSGAPGPGVCTEEVSAARQTLPGQWEAAIRPLLSDFYRPFNAIELFFFIMILFSKTITGENVRINSFPEMLLSREIFQLKIRAYWVLQ